jgi:hypothetical protein
MDISPSYNSHRFEKGGNAWFGISELLGRTVENKKSGKLKFIRAKDKIAATIGIHKQVIVMMLSQTGGSACIMPKVSSQCAPLCFFASLSWLKSLLSSFSLS